MIGGYLDTGFLIVLGIVASSFPGMFAGKKGTPDQIATRKLIVRVCGIAMLMCGGVKLLLQLT
jgi:hypothetical protein